MICLGGAVGAARRTRWRVRRREEGGEGEEMMETLLINQKEFSWK